MMLYSPKRSILITHKPSSTAVLRLCPHTRFIDATMSTNKKTTHFWLSDMSSVVRIFRNIFSFPMLVSTSASGVWPEASSLCEGRIKNQRPSAVMQLHIWVWTKKILFLKEHAAPNRKVKSPHRHWRNIVLLLTHHQVFWTAAASNSQLFFVA